MIGIRRRRNPTIVRGNGPRVYRGVRRIDTGGANRGNTNGGPQRVRSRGYGWGGYGWGGGWGGGWGYPVPLPVFVPVGVDPCVSPITGARLDVTAAWAINCFWPAYQSAQIVWGPNAPAVAGEIVMQLLPELAMRPSIAAERELRRRIDLAIAVLLNAEGIPTRFPANPPLPRPPRASQIEVPWIRALVTGWI